MSAFEVVYAFKTNPGAVISECAAATSQSLQVKASDQDAYLQQLWAFNATGGLIRVRSPRMHDDVQGIRLRVNAKSQQLLMPYGTEERLYSTDTLTVETTGGEAETDCVFALLRYPQLPGSEGQLASWAEIQPNIESYLGVEVAAKTGAVGKWGTPVALNNSMDLFKRPSKYAILGYQVSAEVGAVVISGTDVGPLRFGGPGMIEPDVTSEWFVRLSEEAKEAAIPVFNSQNIGQINLELGGQTAEAESKVTFFCAKLRA